MQVRVPPRPKAKTRNIQGQSVVDISENMFTAIVSNWLSNAQYRLDS